MAWFKKKTDAQLRAEIKKHKQAIRKEEKRLAQKQEAKNLRNEAFKLKHRKVLKVGKKVGTVLGDIGDNLAKGYEQRQKVKRVRKVRKDYPDEPYNPFGW